MLVVLLHAAAELLVSIALIAPCLLLQIGGALHIGTYLWLNQFGLSPWEGMWVHCMLNICMLLCSVDTACVACCCAGPALYGVLHAATNSSQAPYIACWANCGCLGNLLLHVTAGLCTPAAVLCQPAAKQCAMPFDLLHSTCTLFDSDFLHV